MSVAELTVLVVEDHDFQRRTILQILANLGVGSLLEAADGEQALGLLERGERPDVVVCDLDLPGMDGVELVQRISERHADVAVVFASGLEEEVVETADATARAQGVRVLASIQKPLTARGLLAAIGEHRPGSGSESEGSA
jgi:CheY-like chemotaxis protein